MTTDELTDALGGQFHKTSDRRLSVSSKIARRAEPGETIVVVGSEVSELAKTQLNAFADALHLWLTEANGAGRVQIALGANDGAREETERVVQRMGTLRAALAPSVQIEVTVNLVPCELEAPDFRGARPEWLGKLRARDDRLEQSTLAREISAALGDSSFRWYATLTGKELSGRVEGLEVCRLDPTSDTGTLQIGQVGRSEDRTVRARFRAIADADEVPLSPATTKEALRIIQALIEDRANGLLREVQEEHYLESEILRGARRVSGPTGTLEPVHANGQFPTLWSNNKDARYLDALLREGSTPWAVELKVKSGGGTGSYLRHGVVQATLYRAFIRSAESLHPWFTEPERGLDPTVCEAAVAFPRLEPRSAQRVSEVKGLAELFDVAVIELAP